MGGRHHHKAFNSLPLGDFNEVPTHFFEVARLLRHNINTAGWHVAHIYNAKDRNLTWEEWDRNELIRRFVRNLHPCNCFHVPKEGWHAFGGDRRVIAFFANLYQTRYRGVWPEFVHLAGGSPFGPLGWDEVRYSTAGSPKEPRMSTLRQRSSPVTQREGITSYRFSRLCFKADVIEPLQVDDLFEVITPDGVFRMTKRDFYAAFPRVPLTKSYQADRIYHFPKIPKAALPFLVPDEGAPPQ